MSKTFKVTDSTFNQEVLDVAQPVLVDFYADWCGPCRVIAPMIDSIADEFDGQIGVAKLDIDVNGVTPDRYGVRSIPTLILFNDGEPVERWVGVVPKAQLIEDIQEKIDALSTVNH